EKEVRESKPPPSKFTGYTPLNTPRADSGRGLECRFQKSRHSISESTAR
ncbi:hypothetical protein A2U01_0066642, partial [Trifolium medium]|nr:hypothetical protein [Trifolium medium]